MYFNPEGSTLYLGNWEYNATRIINALARVVENHGGRAARRSYNHGFIVNRCILEAREKYTARIKALKAAIDNGTTKNPDITKKALIATEKDLDNIININNDPIEVYHGIDIRFIVDDYIYYLSFDDNYLFDFHYIKTPIIDGQKYSKDAACETFSKKEWFYDCFLEYRAANGDVIEAANIIFNFLINASESEIIRDSRRERVRNTYNPGYHYESIYRPERIETIDF